MKHVFLFDPKSFRDQQWKMDAVLDSIGQFFRTQEKPDFSIQMSRFRRDALGIIQKEVETAREGDTVRVYAVGSEEILYDCLNGIAEIPDVELAFIPHGESSDFLCNFGEGKTELFKDIPSIVQGEAITTDIIDWGLNYALNSCLIGITPTSAVKVKDIKENFKKSRLYVFLRITNFLNNVLMAFNKKISGRSYKITIDDRDFSGNYSLINIVNGPYYEGKMTGSSTAVPDDGLLDIAMIRSAGPLKTMSSTGRYIRGKKPSNGIYIQAKKITIQSEREMWIQLDNEFIKDTNIEINVVPGALQMVTVSNLSYQKS
jgi:diacylglycerol kinase family enzyme